MPLAPVIATTVTTPQTRTISLFIGGRDFTNVFDLTATTIQDSGTAARATAAIRIKTALADAPEIYDQAVVQLTDHAAGVVFFTGFVISRHPTTDIAPMVEVVAADIGSLLDDSWIVYEERPEGETFEARIAYLWGRAYLSPHLSSDMSFVLPVGGTQLAQTFANLTMREAIEHIFSGSPQPHYHYVDPLGRLHVFNTEANAAPYDVVVGTPAGGQVAPEDLDIDYDSNAFYNRVFVQGGTPEGSGYFWDWASISAANGNIRTTVIQAPDCSTEAHAGLLASQLFARSARAQVRGSFSVSSPYDGWRAGQTMELTEPDLGYTAEEFRIVRVTTRFVKLRTGYQRHYTVEFGAPRWVGGSMGWTRMD